MLLRETKHSLFSPKQLLPVILLILLILTLSLDKAEVR